jgi:hypothetical protein
MAGEKGNKMDLEMDGWKRKAAYEMFFLARNDCWCAAYLCVSVRRLLAVLDAGGALAVRTQDLPQAGQQQDGDLARRALQTGQGRT